LNLVIVAPHFDDEFFAYTAIKREWPTQKFNIRAVFLTDSAKLPLLGKHEEFIEPKCFSQIRQEESRRFCLAHNIDPIFTTAIFPDGHLSEVPKTEVEDLLAPWVRGANLFILPEMNEHPDHDLASMLFEKLASRKYIVHNDDLPDDDEYQRLVYKFKFWYPSQTNSFTPKTGAGYLKG